MYKKLFNTEQIVSVSLNDKVEVSCYEYFKEKKYWFKKTRKEGWYYDKGIFGTQWVLTTVENIEREFLIIDGKVYESPYVKVRLTNDDWQNIDFKTYDECEVYVNKLRIKLDNKLIIL